MLEDGWPWTQDPDGVLLEVNLRTTDQPVPAWATFQGDATGWPRVVRLVVDAIAEDPWAGTKAPEGRRIPNTPARQVTTDRLLGLTEDQAVELVRAAYRRQRDYDTTHKVLGILRGSVDPTDRVRRSIRQGGDVDQPGRKLDDQSFASAYRLLVEDGHHDACARLAGMLGTTSAAVRSRVKRLRAKGVLGPATGTRVGES